MYKLLIADDEARIRRGIRNILNWQEMGIEVVGEAEDGELALEAAKQYNPDIILLDICMPFLNGLELIKKLKECEKDPVIIIITGHDEFKFVQEALKLRVFDYILKPVIKDDLKSCIEKAIEKIEKENNDHKYNDWVKGKLSDNLETVKENLLRNLLKGTIGLEQIKKEMEFIGVNFKNSIGVILVKYIERFNIEANTKRIDERLIGFAIKNIAIDLLEPFNPMLVYNDEDNILTVICSINEPGKWLHIGKVIEESINKYLGCTVIAEHKVVDGGLTGIHDTYLSIKEDMDKKLEYKPIVLLAVKYIENNYYDTDLNLDKVADIYNISPSYLSKLMKEEIGMSFIDYLTYTKIKKALAIMEDPTVKIYDVAEMVGYSNQHYFCKAFKKVMGCSPTDYRTRRVVS